MDSVDAELKGVGKSPHFSRRRLWIFFTFKRVEDIMLFLMTLC